MRGSMLSYVKRLVTRKQIYNKMKNKIIFFNSTIISPLMADLRRSFPYLRAYNGTYFEFEVLLVVLRALKMLTAYISCFEYRM